MGVYRPQYQLTSELLVHLETIARMQGQMQSSLHSVGDATHIYALANIDAVHFSTKLEGNTLSYEQVTRALGGQKPKTKSQRDLKEVLNYAKARAFLLDKAKTMDNVLVLGVHQQLVKNILMGKLAGHYRQSQNVIKDTGSNAIVYLPPQADDVPGLMKSLLAWVRQSTLAKTSPLLIAPIFHYYFVTIHPFLDGNGRSTRLLTNFILEHQGYTVAHYAAIEKQHELNRAAYYRALRRLQAPTFYDIPTDIDLTPWLNYWLGCLEKTYAEALSRCQAAAPSDPALLELEERLQKAVGLFKKHKKLKAADYATLLGLGRTQTVADLNKLTQLEIIQRLGGGRSAVYQIKTP